LAWKHAHARLASAAIWPVGKEDRRADDTHGQNGRSKNPRHGVYPLARTRNRCPARSSWL